LKLIHTHPERTRPGGFAVGDDWFTSSAMAAGVEYLLPQGLDVGSVDALLTKRLELECERVRTGRRTFYDTFDGRLHAKGLVLVHEEMRLVLRDDERERAGLAYPEKAPPRVAVRELPDGPLRAALAPICGVRALQATASLRGRRRLLRVLDGERKTIVRLVAEEATLARNGSGNGAHALRPRLHVVPVRGYAKALRGVRGALEDDLGLIPATEPLRDEAVWRAGGAPGGVSSKVVVAFAPDLRADRAAAALAGRLVAVIEANLPGALAEIDTEFLHDLRVAVRRTRSLQRELKRVFPPAPLAHFRTEFRWLQRVTGPTRDLDVYLADLDGAPDLDPLRAVLVERRTRERAAMERALRSPRTRRMLEQWSVFVEHLADAPPAGRDDALRPIFAVTAQRIARVYKTLARMGDAIDAASAPLALHDLRKKGKELRYLLEFFAPLFPSSVIDPMVASLKALQDTLGRFQDREVQAALLRELSNEVATREGGGAALMAMGVLAQRLDADRAQARSEFAGRFGAFAAPRQRALVRETFG
jgi:CHAD domain-containing protein